MPDFVESDYPLTKHFRLGELWCPCCHGVNIGNLRRLCLQLEFVRADYGPIEIASGFRCTLHNLEVRGRTFSRHLEGKAADIKVWTDGDRFRLVHALLKHGFRRIGIGKTIIHGDIDESAVPILWTYYP